MSDKIVSKTGDFDDQGYVDLLTATGRQSQYVSRYIEPRWHEKHPDEYPFLGEGLQLMYSEFRVEEQDWVLVPYDPECRKHLGDFYSFCLSVEDAKVFKERVDEYYAPMDAFFSGGEK